MSNRSLIDSPGYPRFAKSNPKTITFDPITGNLRDTRQSPHRFTPYRNSTPSKNSQAQMSSEIISNLNDVKYTKASPKFVPSFPITGKNNGLIVYKPEFKEDANKFFGVDVRSASRGPVPLSDYGSMIMQRR